VSHLHFVAALIGLVVFASVYVYELRILLMEAGALSGRVLRRHPERVLRRSDRVLSVAFAVVLALVWTPFALVACVCVVPAMIVVILTLVGEMLEPAYDWCHSLLVALVTWTRHGRGKS